jgi:hypothetical protein
VPVDESVAVTVNVKEPEADGVPLMTPLEALMLVPVGRLPLVTLYVYGLVPLVAVTTWLYAVPCVPLGKVVGFSVIVVAFTVSV